MDNLTICDSEKDIQASLVEVMRQNKGITIWQMMDGKRMIMKAKILEVNPLSDLICLELNDGASCPDLHEKTVLYMHSPSRNILFKQDIMEIQESKVYIKIPKEIRIRELRKNRRFCFQLMDSINAKIEPIIGEVPSLQQRKKSLTTTNPSFFFPVLDISDQGIAVLMTRAQALSFAVDGEVIIYKITNEKIPDEFLGRVVYMKEMEINYKGISDYVRVGFSFKYQLIPFSLGGDTSIKRKSVDVKKVQEKSSGPKTKEKEGHFYGYTIEEQNRIFQNIEMHDSKLAVQIRESVNYIEQLRFLTPSMLADFFRQNDIQDVAVSLRLSSKKLISVFLENTSSNIAEDLVHYLKTPQSAGTVAKYQEKLIIYIREKENKGQFVLSPKGFDTYV